MDKKDIYTDSIMDLLRLIKKYEKKDERICKKIKKTIYDMLDPTYFGGKHNISRKASNLVKKMKIKEEITYSTWKELGKYKTIENVSGNGSRAFIIEHYIPRHYVIDELLNIKKPNKADILKIINKKIRTCIITAKENEKLNNLGFNVNRPKPELAYKKANIIIINKW